MTDGGVAGPGNITSQAGVGTYTYPAAGQPRPHAVTSLTGTLNGITNPSFAYDANGNMTSRAGSTLTWSSYNYPTDISAGDATGTEEVQLSYGPDRQRWKQIYTGGPTGTETTYYIGGLVDLVFIGGVANYRHYIYAGSEPVAVYNRTAAGNTMSYMLEDHEGSVSNIASKSGVTDVNESFSAFGTRRNPSTWSGAPTTTDLNTIAGLSRQGYTFQTWLGQSMGLNHMNGRVQEAILGRFLSPDPHITDPSNAQNYNRYTYVNNNPLTFTDPTGFSVCLLATYLPGHGGSYPFDDNPVTGGTFRWTYGFCAEPGDGGGPAANRDGGSGGQAHGHDYRKQNTVCKRPLSEQEQRDLISRFTVPNAYTQGQRQSDGIHLVTNNLGIPGGFVKTTFASDGLSGQNVTTPFHVFTGVVDRSISNTDSGASLVTHGYGSYGSLSLPPSQPYASMETGNVPIDFGEMLDLINEVTGPVIFNSLDAQAARYAMAHFPGC